MRLGIPIWNDHVSPVLDAAERVLIVEIEDSAPVRRVIRRLATGSVAATAASVRELGVDVLICGAVSGELARLIAASGTNIVPWVTGPADEVAGAYVAGTLADARYRLPGCGGGMRAGRRRRARRGPGRGRGQR